MHDDAPCASSRRGCPSRGGRGRSAQSLHPVAHQQVRTTHTLISIGRQRPLTMGRQFLLQPTQCTDRSRLRTTNLPLQDAAIVAEPWCDSVDDEYPARRAILGTAPALGVPCEERTNPPLHAKAPTDCSPRHPVWFQLSPGAAPLCFSVCVELPACAASGRAACGTETASWRSQTLRRLERHVGRAGDFGVVAHTGFADLHSREVGQLFGGPLERHPGAQVDQILLQTGTQRSRQQLQFFIQGEKDQLRTPGSPRNRASGAPRHRHAS
jgi:hypothetical protein